jgi:tRNA-specific 2-thiouridylase
MFPLGDTPSKAEIRLEAEARGLTVAQKPDSHDICFIPDGDTKGWLDDRLGVSPGDIVDVDGKRLGGHEGTHSFTIGQRKGVGIGVPTPDGRPRFVLEVRPKTNTLVVGPKEALDLRELAGTSFTWAGIAPANPTEAFACHMQVRAHADPVPAMAQLIGDELVLTPDSPLNMVSPGQTAVIYIDTRVLGQVTIARTVSAVERVSA